MKRFSIYSVSVSLLLAAGVGCSSERNTVTSKVYHNLTAHYNGYYYALEEITKIEKTIRQSNTDDYYKILRLFPTFDSALAKGYEKEIEEAIKMASIAIQRHPNSKWVDDAYILVGKARLYSLDWGNAIQTFKYVNTKSVDINARHRAIINLIRTFTEHKEFNNAVAAIDFLAKEKLNKKNLKDYHLECAYFYQIQEDYDNMVRNLAKASPLLTKKDRRGRIYFIIGQVYQELGFESEAFNYYKRCLSTNPEYETDFYARLYMAQVAEISKSRDINTARKSFKRLLKDRKNKEFKDKIYYELGAFELKQQNLQPAITNFNLSIREGTNKRIDGEAYLRLGEIYYDTLRSYELSSAYYDSAISSLPQDYENYEAIKARQQILNEFVKNLKTIEWQDSLLAMASLDSASLRSRIDSILTVKKQQEEAANKGKKKKKNNRIEIESTGNIFNTGEGTAETADWYFGNPSAVSLGETEFKRIWGNVPLEDNWRRSQKLTMAGSTPQDVDEGSSTETKEPEVTNNKPVDPVAAEFEKVNSQIPRTEEQKKEALKKIEDAYFRLGDIYYFNLLEKNNALSSYKKLLKRFPESEHTPEVLYKIYLILKETDPSKAEQYAETLKRDFPYTTYAKILLNPDYLKESSQTAEQQKRLYKEAYQKYQEGNYSEASGMIGEALALGQTIFNANLELLKVLIIGKTADVASFKTALTKFIETNPDSNLIPYAQKLLETADEFQKKGMPQKSTSYIEMKDGPHFFIIISKKSDNIEEAALTIMEQFNDQFFQSLNLKINNLALDEEYTMTMVSELPDDKAGLEYLKTFNANVPSELKSRKFDKFIITSENFNILYRTKGLNEYNQFFEKNYQATNP